MVAKSSKWLDWTLFALALIMIFVMVCACSKKSSESYKKFTPVKQSFPYGMDLKKLAEIAKQNETAAFLYQVLLGDGNNGDPNLPSYGLLFCLYTPRMFTGATDVRPLLANLQTTTYRAELVRNMAVSSMNALDQYFRANGISNPCDRMNLFVHQVQPIRNYNKMISAFVADLIPMTLTGEISIPK